MRVPYIGITGVRHEQESIALLQSFPLYAPRKIMIGALATRKTLLGQKNKKTARYHLLAEISKPFISHPLALNLIHYATDDITSLADQLAQMTHAGGPHLHGFQLNIAWPRISEIKAYRSRYPDKQIVLQIGRHAFDMISHSPGILAVCVSQYGESIDYVLLDASGGKGILFDPKKIRPYIVALLDKKVHVGIGVAGGLGAPQSFPLLKELARDFPFLSTDAESKIRDADDNLEIIPAIQYLFNSVRIFMHAKISDTDLDSMNPEELKSEALKLRSAIRTHRDQLGDNRCWVDDIALYKAVADNAPIITRLPPKEFFIPHCDYFWETRQCPEKQSCWYQW